MQADVALTSLTASVLGRLFGAELTLAERAPLGDVAAQLASRTCPDGTAALVDTWTMTAEVVPFDLVGRRPAADDHRPRPDRRRPAVGRVRPGS